MVTFSMISSEKNNSFLHDSWLLPIYKVYEFGPCLKLGLRVGYVQEMVFISLTEYIDFNRIFQLK